MTTSLLISDRDKEECKGIRWFVERSSSEVDLITLVHSSDSLLQTLDQSLPDILILELDMLDHHCYQAVYSRILSSPGMKVIATSAEATYEKAMNALKIQAIDLLIKPHSPARLQSLLSFALREGGANDNLKTDTSDKEILTYKDLFIKKKEVQHAFDVMAFQPENEEQLQELATFIRSYSFPAQVQIFTLSSFVICFSEKASFNATAETNKLLQFWHNQYFSPIAAVVNEGSSSEMSVQQLYQETKNMLHLTFYKGYQQVFTFTEAIKWEKIDPFLTSEEQREWIDMLNHGENKRIKDWLYEHLLHIQPPYPEPSIIRTRLTSILAQIRRYMRTYYLDHGETEASYQNLFENIIYSTNLYRIVQDLYLFIQSILENVKKNRQQGSMDAVEKGVLYIESHYWDPDLTLLKVAEAIERNPSYFSHLLNKQKGFGFRPLLTKIRLREAEKLLLETSMTIKEIAAVCGFQTSNYFSRTFKEHKGTTPKQFRENTRVL
ncbi:helix-turn-helix domain-containing protein [Alteribacter populi]|uniref:helix-turn-helix domain-containing protein n=1 Tax=Alteribacter populi TaxID=2011011 RepID=UPI0018E28612|nr:helix-turn-helix domain-containing protein [Alteribacter populi]